MNKFSSVSGGILSGIDAWETQLHQLDHETISVRKNSQQRTIKQIVGHMIDSASNNLHRIIHLQYQETPLKFPNYAINGNNDRWIAIQNYQDESSNELIMLWKYIHMHLVHVINNVDDSKLQNAWDSNSEYGLVSLDEMILDFLRHFNLHLEEIDELIKNGIS